MEDSTRVSVETDEEFESGRFHEDSGEVSVGDTTFRFSVDAPSDDAAADEEGPNPNDNRTEGPGDDADMSESADPRRIGPLSAIPSKSTIRCEAVKGRRGVEVILQRNGDDVLAWRNSCPHEPQVRLDPGGGALVYGDKIVCREHGARFECDDGFCTSGPCRGQELDPIGVEVRDTGVYLSDDRFEAGNLLE
ncbi:Rieske (2Fe-2S) protein [Halobium salinum]|uniref:Rieske (2Fe-2S) protein n=1 Tax=Halobium salinum TaxID=1364940 RepID=A0ABD5PBW9_9EURY|nr:Rieske 2Fe-2S domain-containing protein [Halobium salinum]